MGFSLGELFLSLGFDVDDTKLKNFRSLMKDSHEEMVKFSTAAAGSLATLAVFVQNAANGAVQLNNMASQWGANTQAAQTFANALHQVNSQISVAAGQEKYRGFAEMINAKVPVGSGAYGALSLLGVTNPWGNPEDVLSEIRHNLPGNMARLGTTPEKQRARASDLLSQIGLGGSLSAVLEPDEQYNSAGRYNTRQDALDSLGSYAKATAEFHEAIDKFENTTAAHLAPAMTRFFNAITAVLNRLPSADALGDQLLGEQDRVSKEGVAGYGAGLIGDFFGVLSGRKKINWGDNNASQFTGEQRAGILRALMDESGMNPAAVGDSGRAYGIAQWHPDRQENFRRWSGHDIRGSSREEQMQFVNYELTQGMERSAGEKIMQARSEQEAYLLTKKYYERPLGSEKIEINIHSNATDNAEVAKLITQHFQKTIEGAYSQTNLGAQQ